MNGFKNFSINKKNNNLLKILTGSLVLMVLLFAVNLFAPALKNYFYAISSPIQKTFLTAGESSSLFLSSLFNGSSIFRENEILKKENEELLAQIAYLQSIEQANRDQSDISISCQNSGFEVVMAGVIGLDDDDILSINKGSADGISVGMPVINQQNVLYGKVFKVYKNFSQIMLVSNKNSVVIVKVQQKDVSDSEITGVIRGKGGLSAYLDSIPIDSDINLQDVLVTSATEKLFPKDMLVAKISQKEKNDQESFQKAQVDLLLNIKTTDNLFVITNYKQSN